MDETDQESEIATQSSTTTAPQEHQEKIEHVESPTKNVGVAKAEEEGEKATSKDTETSGAQAEETPAPSVVVFKPKYRCSQFRAPASLSSLACSTAVVLFAS